MTIIYEEHDTDRSTESLSQYFSNFLKNSIDTACRRLQHRIGAKSVGRLPEELHLTRFPQGRERRFVHTNKPLNQGDLIYAQNHYHRLFDPERSNRRG